MSLEQNLSRTAEAWLSGEPLPPDRSAALDRLIQQRERRRRLQRVARVSVAGAAVVSVGLFWPVMVSVASGMPVLGPVILRWAATDRGLNWAAHNGYVVPVGKSAAGMGYTFRVESVMADAARTEIHYVIEGPGLSDASPPPVIEATFNNWLPAGRSSSESALVDGRLLGRETLPPLPHPVARVSVTAVEIAGVKGDWSVSFMVSRTESDKLTRTVDVPNEPIDSAPAPSAPTVTAPASAEPLPADHPLPVLPPAEAAAPSTPDRTLPVNSTWKGNGYSLVVERLLLAPTETVIEMRGTVPKGFHIATAELIANGRPVPIHQSEMRYDGYFRFAFDRLEGDPPAATFRLKEVNLWQPGGPVIDFSRPGVRTTYGWTWFEPVSVQAENGRTKVFVRTGILEGRENEKTENDFPRWAIVDAEGKSHPVVSSGSHQAEDAPIASITEMEAEGELKGPLRLEAQLHAVPVPGPFEVTIPLR